MKLFASPGDSRALLCRLVILSAIHIIYMVCWWFELVRFAYEPLNNISFVVVSCIPGLLFLFGLQFPKKWMKVAAVLWSFPLGSLSTAPAIFCLAFLPTVLGNGQSMFFYRIGTVPSTYYNLGLRRGDHVVYIRQEKTILPGLLLVREIYRSPGWDLDVEVIDPDKIRAVVDGKHTEPDGNVLTPKRWVYF